MRFCWFILGFVLMMAYSLGFVMGQDVKPAVPVFQPGKDVKESTVLPKGLTPPTKDTSKDLKDPPMEVPKNTPPVKVKVKPEEGAEDGVALPLAFIKNRIETLPVGTKAYITVADVRVDSSRKCFLDPDGIYGSNGEGRAVEVVRDENGFSLIFDKEMTHQWVAQELPADVKWMMVKGIALK